MISYLETLPRDYKTVFMLNSAEHEISIAIESKILKNTQMMYLSCLQMLKCQQMLAFKHLLCPFLHFNIYKQDKFHAQLS